MSRILALCLLVLAPCIAIAQSPVGRWQTVNEDTGEAEAIVEIWLEQQELRGRIIELIDPPEPNPVCDQCEGERKDQPVVGMVIIWGLTESEDAWEGGHILDPNNGVAYRARLRVNESGLLEVRGFVGIALLGRTQIWHPLD